MIRGDCEPIARKQTVHRSDVAGELGGAGGVLVETSTPGSVVTVASLDVGAEESQPVVVIVKTTRRSVV